MSSIVQAVDLFCGAGGTSTGLYRACHSMNKRVDLLAINHWTTAIQTHSSNHPGARHMCARLETIRPEDAVPSGRLDILVASPECTHHSIARGGRPMSDQLRASAWMVLRWIEALKIQNILIENVQEFRNWGPLGISGRPLKKRIGETYQAFLQALRSFNYTVDDRVLNAADYGDPTSRRRLFIMARRGNNRIKWPDQTHGESDLFTSRQPYRTAREVIDWTIKGQSIFRRKKPLAPNTMRRIMAGLRKFGGESFIVHLRGTNESQLGGSAKSLDAPMPTLTGSGAHVGLCEPFLVHFRGNDDVESISRPIPTITTKDKFALCEPFIIPIDHTGSGSSGARSVNDPLGTITAENRFALCEPFIIHTNHAGGTRVHDIGNPMPTVTGANREKWH